MVNSWPWWLTVLTVMVEGFGHVVDNFSFWPNVMVKVSTMMVENFSFGPNMMVEGLNQVG